METQINYSVRIVLNKRRDRTAKYSKLAEATLYFGETLKIKHIRIIKNPQNKIRIDYPINVVCGSKEVTDRINDLILEEFYKVAEKAHYDY